MLDAEHKYLLVAGALQSAGNADAIPLETNLVSGHACWTWGARLQLACRQSCSSATRWRSAAAVRSNRKMKPGAPGSLHPAGMSCLPCVCLTYELQCAAMMNAFHSSNGSRLWLHFVLMHASSETCRPVLYTNAIMPWHRTRVVTVEGGSHLVGNS